jgi:hypothetical protein
MIVAISNKGSKGKRRAYSRKRTRGKSLDHPRSLQSNHTSMIRLPTYLVGSAGWRTSCDDRKRPPTLAYKKSDGGHKLRATCSERIRAKGVYLPPTPSALYEGADLKIFVKIPGETNDHRRNH